MCPAMTTEWVRNTGIDASHAFVTQHGEHAGGGSGKDKWGDTQAWKQQQRQKHSKTIAYKHSLHYGSAGNVHTPDNM